MGYTFSTMDLRLAVRSLVRHKIRSIISLCAIVFGEFAILLSGGFIEWNLYAMRTTTIYSLLGHIQIARPKYFTEGVADPFAFLLPEKSKFIDTVRAIPGVEMIMPRLTFGGLLSQGETTVSFLGEGIDPEMEERKSRLAPQGEINRFITVSKGQALSGEDPKGVILGEGLAASLGVNLGDKIVLLVSTSSGSMNAVEANVRGLFFTLSKAYNDNALRMPISLARELLRVSGSHLWMLVLDRSESTNSVLAQLGQFASLRNETLEIKPWYELADFYNKTAQLYTRQMDVLFLIIGLIVVLSISNIMMMNVLDRTGEIGTLMAMGARRAKVILLFLNEGVALGAIGSLAGLLIGLLLARAISAIGIPMPPAPGMSHSFVAEILITPRLALTASLTAFATVLIATMYPAWKASRLKVVDALRHNR